MWSSFTSDDQASESSCRVELRPVLRRNTVTAIDGFIISSMYCSVATTDELQSDGVT
jgi:hypothetical protein